MAALPVVVNFTRFRLEPHVQKALLLAWSLSGARPVNSAHLLEAALIVPGAERSAAFRKIASLLPLSTPPRVADPGVVPPDLGGMLVTPPLAESFSVAEGFLEDKKAVWGRDYVTLALLARNDPSLEELARKVGSNLEMIRREWFDFVRSTDQRRTHDSWERWWRGAGVALPSEAKRAPTAAAYLFTWNPERLPFPELKDHVEELKRSGSTVVRWSTGNRETMRLGERIFLLRQGEPRGVVGVGETAGTVVEAPHWDPLEREAGRRSRLVDVKWVALASEPFLDLASLIQDTGNSKIWSTSVGGVALEPPIAQRLEEMWPRAWARHSHGLGDDSVPVIEARHWIARFDADTGVENDRLKVDQYVNAFARVMASRALTPPLSIGLFGDWGTGKTFFMDRLYARIEEIKSASTDNPLYWQRICQIRFNAWHYTETNLWASLVSTIFGELCGFLNGKTDDADDFNRLLNQLELAGELRKAARENADRAKTRLDTARTKVEEAKDKLASLPPQPTLSDHQLRDILAKSVTEVALSDTDKLAGLLRQAAELSGRPEFSEAAERLKTGKTTVAEASALLDEARTLSSRTGFWWGVLSGAKLYKTRGFWIMVGVLIVLPLLFWLASRRWELAEGWAHVWTLIGETLTLTAGIIAAARSRLGDASAVFDRLGVLQANVARRLEEARAHDRRDFEAARDKAIADEATMRVELEQSQREETEAADAYRKAEEAVQESTSQARLARFIRERTSSADYEKHLGLIAMIHRDFQKLSTLMKAARDGTGDATLPRIDRIVLYIDDLDRCYPPEKVIRVLEAVHLLLFFPLFVVVVGVDSRWVSRALSRHYQGMLADEATVANQQQDELLRAPANSQDFLEKIFQVPFWLRRMEPEAVKRLIHSLITSDEVTPTAGAVTIPPPEDGPAAKAAGGAGVGTTPEDPARAAAKRATTEAESEAEVIGEGLAIPTQRLTITEAEREFMNKVSPLMPRTPRSVKRFVNIYRLYKAALSPLALGPFLGTPARLGNFRAVQVLLALVTGTPRFAQRVFRELYANEGGSAKKLSDLVSMLEEDGDETSRTTLEAVRDFAKGEDDLDLDALREVSALVTRFSVHHMVSAAPGEAGLG